MYDFSYSVRALPLAPRKVFLLFFDIFLTTSDGFRLKWPIKMRE